MILQESHVQKQFDRFADYCLHGKMDKTVQFLRHLING